MRGIVCRHHVLEDPTAKQLRLDFWVFLCNLVFQRYGNREQRERHGTRLGVVPESQKQELAAAEVIRQVSVRGSLGFDEGYLRRRI